MFGMIQTWEPKIEFQLLYVGFVVKEAEEKAGVSQGSPIFPCLYS